VRRREPVPRLAIYGTAANLTGERGWRSRGLPFCHGCAGLFVF